MKDFLNEHLKNLRCEQCYGYQQLTSHVANESNLILSYRNTDEHQQVDD